MKAFQSRAWCWSFVLLAACAKVAGFEEFSNRAEAGGSGGKVTTAGGAGGLPAASKGGTGQSTGGTEAPPETFGGAPSGGLNSGGASNGGTSAAGGGRAAGGRIGSGGAFAGGAAGAASGGNAGLPSGGSAGAFPGGSAGAPNGNGGVAGAALGGTSNGGQGGAPLNQGGSGGTPSGMLADCVLLMHFEEPGWAARTAEVLDSSGRNNHGTPATTTLSTSSQGKFGRAALFDGSGGVVVPDAPSLRATGALSIAAWIYPTELRAAGPGIVSKRRGFGSDVAYTLFLWADTDPHMHLYTDIEREESRLLSTATFETDAWYHVAVVFDGSLPPTERTRLYVNGSLDAFGADDASIVPYTSDLMIGSLPGGGERFVGRIDEVGVWARALSAAEVQRLYGATSAL